MGPLESRTTLLEKALTENSSQERTAFRVKTRRILGQRAQVRGVD
jgi:hypothetical protein